jgi:hypothetical protein
MPDDPLIQQTEEVADKASQQRFADLFDVRRVIGGLFGVYGIILLIASFWASDDDVDRAQGINANLWVGLALLATAAVFFGWALRAPVGAQLVAADDDGSASPAEAPAPRGVDAAALHKPKGTGGSGGSRRDDA